ncbi:MAG: hypothetical protein ABJA10_07525 [Aestuariivirga sp.]
MSGNPIDAVYVNGNPVSKSAVRAWARKTLYDFDTAANFRTYDLDNTSNVLIAGVLFHYDSTDFVTADDGVSCVVDLSGRRFKKVSLTVAGETLFRQQSVQAGSTAAHYKINTNGVPTLSAVPVLVLFIPDLNSLGGATDIKLDAQTAISIKRWNNADPAVDDLIAGVPYVLSVTSTQATIFLSGANA